MKNSFIKNYTNNKVIGSILTVCLLILLVGFSYAFFVYNKTGLYTHTINGGRLSIIYNETTGNNITINNAYPLRDEEALTKALEFEFTITGYNESDKNIYYAIEMDYGEDVENKERFKDSDLKLSLYENEEKIFENEIFNSLDNNDIYYGYINQGTSSESPVTNNYKLRIWINNNVIITDTPDMVNTEGKSVYSTEEFANRYANFKVNIKADLTYDDVGYITYDANGGSFTPEKTSLTTGKVTLQKPVMENKGFLGWSTIPNGEVEYYSGDTYTGNGEILYAVYGETRNVMVDSFPEELINLMKSQKQNNSIMNIYFIEETIENIEVRYNSAINKYDLTKDNQGSVKGWLETDIVGNETLYIGSEGTTYLSSGKNLFLYSTAKVIDLANVDTSMVTDMSSMFGILIELNDQTLGCNNLQMIDLSGFNTSNVRDMSLMFSNCSAITNLDLSNFNTSKVEKMLGMFLSCSNLMSLQINSFDTSKVTNMSSMFMSCNSIENIDLRNFNTSNVSDIGMAYMFAACNNLKNLDLNNFTTSKITSTELMFGMCTNLVSLDISNFDTKQITDMNSMFYGCEKLVSLDLSSFDTSNVTSMAGMFKLCKSLEELDLSNFNVEKVVNTNSMFSGCENLKGIYSNANWNTGKVTNSAYMFSGCSSLVGATNYDSTMVDILMANPDTGYFTKKIV